MSTSLLYHAFNIKEVEYRATKYIGNNIIFKAEIGESARSCPSYQSSNVIVRGKKTQSFSISADI